MCGAYLFPIPLWVTTKKQGAKLLEKAKKVCYAACSGSSLCRGYALKGT
jgi:hypothetical protein